MVNKDIINYKGLTQSEYLAGKATLERFQPIESDWKELLKRIMSAGNISHLWKNHVLTVLVEIIQKDVEESKNSFIKSKDTYTEKIINTDIITEILSWIERLEQYSKQSVKDIPAVQVAYSIKEQLKQSLPPTTSISPFYDQLKAISDIKAQSASYLQQIENSGDLDASLSLLLVYIRNYETIIQRFNHGYSSLPEWYHDKIIMASPKKAVQDRALVVLTPTDVSEGCSLPKDTRFLAGKKEDNADLLYKIEKEQYVSGMKVENAFTVFQLETDPGKQFSFYKNEINPHSPDALSTFFVRNEKTSDYAFGWMVKSRMFLLKEGKREIKISFKLKKGTPDISEDFSIYVSDTKGWNLKTSTPGKKEGDYHVFSLTIDEREPALIPPTSELHQLMAEYPIVKILTNSHKASYDWSNPALFEEVKIDVEVQHIRNFELHNEFGEVDGSKPFYPFGPRAENSSWFTFGNDEIARKPLTELTIKGTWNKLPGYENGYKDLYKGYTDSRVTDNKEVIDNKTFVVEWEWQENNQWKKKAKSSLQLFNVTGEKPDSNMSLTLDLRQQNTASPNPETARCDLFRMSLQHPAIGFGMDEYHSIFAKTMIYNSRHQEDEIKLVNSPLIPLIANMELSYKASVESAVPVINNKSEIQLSRITVLSENEFYPVTANHLKELPFISESGAKHSLYLGISNTLRKRNIRMYFDLIFVKNNWFEKDLDFVHPPTLEWDYRNNKGWEILEPKYILTDETQGFTQSGYIEVELPEPVVERMMDNRLFWLRTRVVGDVSHCLPVRGIYTDCFEVVAENGDGTAIPARSISQLKEENPIIQSISQPLPGYGGKAAESKAHSLAREGHRIANRNRMVALRDYEQIILEQFPDVEKVCCLPPAREEKETVVHVVVFSYTGDNIYPITPVWKLNRIRDYILNFTSPFVKVKVINPLYEAVDIEFDALLKEKVIRDGETKQRLMDQIKLYFAAWISNHTLPDLAQYYSGKALHMLLMNDKNIQVIEDLKVNGKKVDINKEDWCISGSKRWSVFIPRTINIDILNWGIGDMAIEETFKIR